MPEAESSKEETPETKGIKILKRKKEKETLSRNLNRENISSDFTGAEK